MSLSRTRFDAATRAGRPNPLHDFTNFKFGYLPTTTAAAQYTNDTNAFRKFQLSFCNVTAGAVTISVYIVPAGGTVGDQWAVKKDVPLAANEEGVESIERVLESGDSLFLQCSAGSSVTAFANVELQG